MKKYLLPLVLIFVTGILAAQDSKESADRYFQNEEWAKAAEHYENHLNEQQQDSSAWYNLAYSHMKLENYQLAAEYFDKAEKQNYPVSWVSTNYAKALLHQDHHDKAIEVLKRGAEKGSMALISLNTDPAFDPIRNKRGFIEALKKVKANVYPCLSNEKCRAFDFWLGEWEVYVKGNKVGDNSVTLAEGGCAIHENYTSLRNAYSGQSINYYDPIDKKWHQHWVGSGGDVYNYLETDQQKNMLQFQSKFMNRKGEVSLSRLTFMLNDDGTVRQFFENSTDNGKTWTPSFDGLYKKKTQNE